MLSICVNSNSMKTEITNLEQEFRLANSLLELCPLHFRYNRYQTFDNNNYCKDAGRP